MLQIGDLAPHFSGPDQDGNTVNLEDLCQKGPVVLYFYPKDFTPLCTKEACLFRDIFADLEGVSVVGVSTDDEATHKRFAVEHNLNFMLVSDANRSISSAYKARGLMGFMTKRVTFLIDTTQRIRGVYHHELSAKKHVDDVKTGLAALAR